MISGDKIACFYGVSGDIKLEREKWDSQTLFTNWDTWLKSWSKNCEEKFCKLMFFFVCFPPKKKPKSSNGLVYLIIMEIMCLCATKTASPMSQFP